MVTTMYYGPVCADHVMKTFCILSASGLVPPVIAGPTTVNESDSFLLTCDRSLSDPVTAVNWFANGSVVSNEQSSQLQVQRETLQFTNISRNYSGEYNCTIQDDRNNTVSSAVNIIVQCEPSLSRGGCKAGRERDEEGRERGGRGRERGEEERREGERGGREREEGGN